MNDRHEKVKSINRTTTRLANIQQRIEVVERDGVDGSIYSYLSIERREKLAKFAVRLLRQEYNEAWKSLSYFLADAVGE